MQPTAQSLDESNNTLYRCSLRKLGHVERRSPAKQHRMEQAERTLGIEWRQKQQRAAQLEHLRLPLRYRDIPLSDVTERRRLQPIARLDVCSEPPRCDGGRMRGYSRVDPKRLAAEWLSKTTQLLDRSLWGRRRLTKDSGVRTELGHRLQNPIGDDVMLSESESRVRRSPETPRKIPFKRKSELDPILMPNTTSSSTSSCGKQRLNSTEGQRKVTNIDPGSSVRLAPEGARQSPPAAAAVARTTHVAACVVKQQPAAEPKTSSSGKSKAKTPAAAAAESKAVSQAK